MLNRLLNRIKRLFASAPYASQSYLRGGIDPRTGLWDTNRTESNVKIGDVVGNVTIHTQSQLDKHTDFKPGESYRLGGCIVTVHADKASMLAAIAAVDKKREDKWAAKRERTIDIMMMTPQQLRELKFNEWLKERKVIDSKINGIIGFGLNKLHFWRNSYLHRIAIKQETPPPSGKQLDRSKAAEIETIALTVVDKDKVK